MPIKTTQGIRNQRYRELSRSLGRLDAFVGPADIPQCSAPWRLDLAEGLCPPACLEAPAFPPASPSSTSLQQNPPISPSALRESHHLESAFPVARARMDPEVEHLYSKYSREHCTPPQTAPFPQARGDISYPREVARPSVESHPALPLISPAQPPSVPPRPTQSIASAQVSRYMHIDPTVSRLSSIQY